jgi:parvulin-like peptidyl-prolyl isomerase
VRRLLALVAVASSGLLAAGCGSAAAYAAKVNGTVISRSALTGELHDIQSNKAYVQAFDQQGTQKIEGQAPGTFNSAFVANLLTERIEYALIHQELERRKALPAGSALSAAQAEVASRLTDPNDPQGRSLITGFPRSYQDVLISRQAEVDALRTALAHVDLSPAAIRAYYDAHQGQYVTQVCVRHILIANKDAAGKLDLTSSKAKADALKKQLDAGADFAALAKANSADNQGANGGSAASGGDLGCLTSQQTQSLVPEFAQAVAQLPVNQLSDPVQTQFGFHLIEVTKRTTEPFDDRVAADARQRLLSPSSQQFTTLLTDLLAQAKVTVNPQYGTFVPRGDPAKNIAPGGQPPVAPNPPAPGSTTVPGG